MRSTKHLAIDKIAKIKSLPGLDLPSLSKFFKDGEEPLVDATPIGRHRLVQALRNKFGASYRNIRGVSDLIKEYDVQVKAIKDLYKTLEA